MMKMTDERARRVLGVASLTLALSIAAATPLSADQRSKDTRPAPAQVKRQVAAAVNDWSVREGGPSRPAACFDSRQVTAKRSWVLVSLNFSKPFETCRHEDGFGLQLWRKSGGAWQLAAYSSGSGPGACQRVGTFTASEWKAAKRLVC